MNFREKYLEVLQVRKLNEEFGGSLFVFFLVFLSVFLIGSGIQSDWYGLFDFPSKLELAQREDFVAFYRAGELASHGDAAIAYVPHIFREPFSPENKDLLFLNPPHALLFFEPLAYIGYPAAKAVGLLLTMASIAGVLFLIRPKMKGWSIFFIFTSCGAFYNFELLQISPIIIFLLVFAMLHSRDHPFISGAALAIATIKPQYGLLIPVFLIGTRDWRAFAAAAVGSLFLVAVSIGVYGWTVWNAFFSSFQSGAHSAQLHATHGMMTTIGNSLGKFGAGDEIRLVGQLLGIVVCAGLVWYVASRWPRKQAAAVSLLAMSLAAPSFMFYDWLTFAVALFLVMNDIPKWPVSFQFFAGLLWVSPVVHDVVWRHDPSLSMYFSGLIPAITVVVLLLIMRQFSAIGSDAGAMAGGGLYSHPSSSFTTPS